MLFRDDKATLYARFLKDPTNVVMATPEEGSGGVSGTGGGGGSAVDSGIQVAASAAANAAMVVAATGAGASVSPGVALDVVSLGDNLSEEVCVCVCMSVWCVAGERRKDMPYVS